MPVMSSELYDALIEAGASEEKARKAAEAVAAYDTRFAALDVPSATLVPTLLIGVGGLVLLVGAWAMAAPHLRHARPA